MKEDGDAWLDKPGVTSIASSLVWRHEGASD